MKLQNKKTGEIREAISQAPIDVYFYDQAGRDGLTRRSYNSLAELNEEWEDAEGINVPIIKDEKVRKAVRAWWEMIPDAVTDKRVVYKNNNEFGNNCKVRISIELGEDEE